MSGAIERRGREPSLDELAALAAHADRRAALYRRKVLLGGGRPRRLAELERVSAGAADRLKRARSRAARADQPAGALSRRRT